MDEPTCVTVGRWTIPLTECEFIFSRSSGPGGQNVNKVNSKVQLRWRPADSTALPAEIKHRLFVLLQPRLTEAGDLLISSQRHRNQLQNKLDCQQKLSELLTGLMTVAKPRRPTRPTRASKERRQQAKQQTSLRKQRRRPPSLDD